MSPPDQLQASSRAHANRLLKQISNPPFANYHQAWTKYGRTLNDKYEVFTVGAIPKDAIGKVNDPSDKVRHFCIAKGQADELVIQFLRRPEFRGYLHLAITLEKGISEVDDGSVIFDGGHADSKADNILLVGFEIGMRVTLTWGPEQPPRKKVVKCKGLSFDLPGLEMDILGDFDAKKNHLWDDNTKEYFDQTFNFIIDNNSEEGVCFKFTRKESSSSDNGTYTMMTWKMEGHGQCDEIVEMSFTFRHHNEQNPHPGMITTASIQQQQAIIAAQQQSILRSARFISNTLVDSNRAMSNLIYKTCHKNCRGYCTC